MKNKVEFKNLLIEPVFNSLKKEEVTTFFRLQKEKGRMPTGYVFFKLKDKC